MEFAIEPELAGGYAGIKTNGFWQVGHGTVCPVPSAGYSIDCPQCGHTHFRKSLIDSLVEIQTPIAPIVHPKMKTGKEFPSAFTLLVGVEVTRLISILDSTHHLTQTLSPNSVGGEGDAFAYSLTGAALVSYALREMFMVPIQKNRINADWGNGRSGDRIRAKKEGNPFGSPNRNCEKL